MSRYRLNPEKQEEKTITEIFEKKGDFFLQIVVRDYKAKIKTCGDITCGLPLIFDTAYQLCKNSGIYDKGKLIEFLNKVLEENDGNKFDDN